jgi:hypothetical protein
MCAAWPIPVQIQDETLIIADSLAVDGKEAFAAPILLQASVAGDITRGQIESNHHPINGKYKPGEMKPFQHVPCSGVHLLFRGHSHVLRLVHAQCS